MSEHAPTDAARPDATWTLESLERYALERANVIHGFGRKTLVQTWLFGEALAYIRQIKTEGKEWMKWLKNQPYSHGTATNAIKLHERIPYDDLESCDGMTPTDLKIALDIIKKPPVKQRPLATSAPQATAVQDATVATNAPTDLEAAAERSDNADAAARHVTTTDYSRSNGKPTTKPGVGVTLTAAEVLGKALNLIIEAEKLGIEPDCGDILTKLSEKVTSLIQPLPIVAA